MKEDIIREAKRIEEDALYSSKGHFYAGQSWGNLHLWIGVPASVMAAVAGASALSDFQSHTIVAGILSIIVAALTAVGTFLNPDERASAHKKAGSRYNSLRNAARIFYSVELTTAEDDSVLADKLKEFDILRSKLNEESPQIPNWAFKKARTGIQAGEAEYEVDHISHKVSQRNND